MFFSWIERLKWVHRAFCVLEVFPLDGIQSSKILLYIPVWKVPILTLVDQGLTSRQWAGNFSHWHIYEDNIFKSSNLYVFYLGHFFLNYGKKYKDD